MILPLKDETNLFVLVAALAQKLGKTPLNHRLFIHRVDADWTVAVNGCGIVKGFKDYSIPPGFCFIEYRAWPAGMFSPHGGLFQGVDKMPESSEAHFIAVLKAAIGRATVNPEETGVY